MGLPSLPNNSTPNAANMKNNRKNRSPKFPTCGNACITVSKRARIPLAIFSNFKTEKIKQQYVSIVGIILLIIIRENIIILFSNKYNMCCGFE